MTDIFRRKVHLVDEWDRAPDDLMLEQLYQAIKERLEVDRLIKAESKETTDES